MSEFNPENTVHDSTTATARTVGLLLAGDAQQDSSTQTQISPPLEADGIAAGTVVLTLDGALPVEHLLEGDRVITRSGMRVLRGITSTVARGGYSIRPHTLGHARPEDQIMVGRDQKLLIHDWRARALTGRDTALMPVSRLADGEYIARSDRPVRMFRLCFDADEVIYAGGVETLMKARPTA